jgi:thiamine-monophosphate kinase
MNEPDFIAALRTLATDPAARGLADDAAVLGDLVVTHDMIIEGVHFLPDDPPGDVAWKLLAVNLSDLAAKGATPLGVLMGYALTGDDGWDTAFVDGLRAALDRFAVPLIGGDTVSMPEGSARALGLTAIGRTPPGGAPARSGARVGDGLFVTGVIGDAGLGLRIARGEASGPQALVDAYRRPVPLLDAGRILAGSVSAMMDVSDGLLLDATRLADASSVALRITIDAVPLSDAFVAHAGDDRAARLAAATAGDDYQLLFAATGPLPALPCRVTRIGRVVEGNGVSLHDADGSFAMPGRLGYLHA